MKKALSISLSLILILALCLSLAACGDKVDSKSEGKSTEAVNEKPAGSIDSEGEDLEAMIIEAFEGAKKVDPDIEEKWIFEPYYIKSKTTEEYLNGYREFGESSDSDNFKALFKTAEITITDKKTFSSDEVEKMKDEWSEGFRTDGITEITSFDYEVYAPSVNITYLNTCYAVKADGKWYVKGLSVSSDNVKQ